MGITVTKGIARGIGNELELLGAQNWIYGANGVSELFSGGGWVELLLGAFWAADAICLSRKRLIPATILTERSPSPVSGRVPGRAALAVW